MSTKRILLGLGGTDFTPVAIQRAVGLAEHHEAEITGVTVVDESRLRSIGPVPAGAGQAARDLREHRIAVTQRQINEATESLQDQCNDKRLRCRIIHEKGEPFALMSNLANHDDVMIFGLRSIFDYGLGFDPQDTLARLVGAGVSPCIAVSRQYREIRRVLLTYSGSVQSANAVKRFVQSRL